MSEIDLNKVREEWPAVLAYLRSEYDVSEISIRTFLEPLDIAMVNNDKIIISVTESVNMPIITKKFSSLITVCIEEKLGHHFDVEFVSADNLNKSIAATQNEAERQDIFEKSGLNPKYTFSSFVVGENSNLAHAAALAVAESPGGIYNPLYIYGGVGLGKTHLMQAIAHFILTNDPSKNVIYVTSETFTNEIIDAIRNEGPQSNARFREKYRNADVLLIDDIQFISGKESTQQEFFHTFNTLYENKKQIVISSDKAPKEINNLEERLCSRFLWGLTVDIQSPNYETRMAILKKKVELDHINNFPDEGLNFIASNVSANIRELEGALTKVVAYSKLTHSEITLEFVESVLQDIVKESQEITPDMIIKIVAEHFGVSVNDLVSLKRSQNIVYPRQICMYLCRDLTECALSLIGKKLGGRDHTTVIHGCDKIQKELKDNDKVRSDIEILKKKIIPA